MCLLILHEYLSSRTQAVLTVLGLFVAGVLAKLVFFDLPFWGLDGSFAYQGGYSFLDAFMRLIDFGAIVGFFVLGFLWLGGARRASRMADLAGWLAISLTFAFLTLELNTFLFAYIPALRAGGISILWSIFALAMILGGIHKTLGIAPSHGAGSLRNRRSQGLLLGSGLSGSVLSHRGVHPAGNSHPLRRVCLSQVPADFRA